MNVIYPTSTNALLQESVYPNISASSRKLKSWEFESFVLSYSTYPNPGSSLGASRLAAQYNPVKGYSFETQRQTARAVGYDTSTINVLLKEIASSDFWNIEIGKHSKATRYSPITSELERAQTFVEYRLAGHLSSLPFKPVPNFAHPSKKTGFSGFAKTTQGAKQARDIRQIGTYNADDGSDILFPDEFPQFDEPIESNDPIVNRPIMDPTDEHHELFPVFLPRDNSPF